MERLVPDNLSGAYSTAYMKNLTESVNFITNKGATVVLDPYVFYFSSYTSHIRTYPGSTKMAPLVCYYIHS